MTMPVAMMPMAVMPAPVPMMPVTVVPVTVPTDLFGLQPIDIVLGYDSRLKSRSLCRDRRVRHSRRHRRSVRSCSKCCDANNRAQHEFQKMKTYHPFLPPLIASPRSVVVRR